MLRYLERGHIMSTNESKLDRTIRVGFGVVAAIVALVVGSGTVLGIVLLAVAAILVVTAAVGFCPLYALLRIRTNKATPAASA
jgi:hypothetical protein